MDVQKLVGSNVRLQRQAANISQEELAARINADQAYISRLEAGQINPTLQTIGQIAAALQIHIGQLFTE